MAGMDLSTRRTDRGISVFWMILAMGTGVFALLAILLVGSDQATDMVEVGEGAQVVVTADGETQVLGTANSPAAGPPTASSFVEDTVTVSGPQETGELTTENVEVPIEAGDPVIADAPTPEAPVAASGGPATEAPADAASAPAIPGEGEVVVDPDGTTAATVPTPSGPTEADGANIAEELGVQGGVVD